MEWQNKTMRQSPTKLASIESDNQLIHNTLVILSAFAMLIGISGFIYNVWILNGTSTQLITENDQVTQLIASKNVEAAKSILAEQASVLRLSPYTIGSCMGALSFALISCTLLMNSITARKKYLLSNKRYNHA
jgi:hypothetical protein